MNDITKLHHEGEESGDDRHSRAVEKALLEAMSDPDAALIRISKVECERSFADFVKQAWHIIEPGTVLTWNWHLEVLCTYIQAFFQRKLEVPRLILNVPPGPMREDSQVETSRGVVALNNIRVGDHVLTHKGRYRQVTAVHEQGTLAILKITTHAGRVTYAAPSHPYLTPTGWVDAKDLKEGDVLAAVNRTEDRCLAVPLPPEEARLLGYLIGDGSIKRQPGFTNGDLGVIEDFERCAETLGFTTHRVRRKTHWFVSLTEKGDHSPREWLRHHEIYGTDSYTKFIPERVLQGNRATLSHFLGAYWSCDEGIDTRVTRRRGSRHRAYATTVSEQLAYDLLQALQLCGIEARVRHKRRKLDTLRQPGGVYQSYSVEVQKEGMTARVLRLQGLCRTKQQQGAGCELDFSKTLWEDPIVSIEKRPPARCLCLTVEDDHSFVCSGIAVKNTMKSVLVSVMAPSWVWTWMPDRRFINLTNEVSLATRDSMRMKTIITSEWYQARWGETVSLSSDQREKSHFINTATGFRQGLGMGGNLTGKRGTDLIIDDPLDARKAFSDTEVATVNNTYDQAVSSRLNEPAVDGIILIMQRLRTNDLTGHLLAKRQRWIHVRIPMRYELGPPSYDPVADLGIEYRHLRDPRTEEHQLMFPARFPEQAVSNLEEDLGEYGSAGQLQQRPSPLGGGIIKKIHWKEWPSDRKLPTPLLIFASYDTAFTEKDHHMSAYSARTTWMVFEDDISGKYAMIMISAWWERVGFPELRRQVKLHNREFNLHLSLIERKASGISLIQQLRKMHVPVRGFDPQRNDKVTRAYLASPLFEAGLVYYPGGRKWPERVIDYVASFPTGAPPSADITDTVTQAVIWVRRKGWTQTPDEDYDDDLAAQFSEEFLEDNQTTNQPIYG